MTKTLNITIPNESNSVPTGIMFNIETELAGTIYTCFNYKNNNSYLTVNIENLKKVTTIALPKVEPTFYNDSMFKYIYEHKDMTTVPDDVIDGYITDYNFNRQTPLMYAVVLNNFDLVKQLLPYDVGNIDDFGNSALAYAYKYNYIYTCLLNQLKQTLTDQYHKHLLDNVDGSFTSLLHLCDDPLSLMTPVEQSVINELSQKIKSSNDIVELLEQYEYNY